MYKRIVGLFFIYFFHRRKRVPFLKTPDIPSVIVIGISPEAPVRESVPATAPETRSSTLTLSAAGIGSAAAAEAANPSSPAAGTCRDLTSGDGLETPPLGPSSNQRNSLTAGQTRTETRRGRRSDMPGRGPDRRLLTAALTLAPAAAESDG